MRIKGLDITRVNVFLFFVLFLSLSVSCSSKTLDYRVHNGQTTEEGPNDPVWDPPAPTPEPDTVKSSIKKIYTKLVAGKYHNCALTKNKQVACWGSSSYNQTGSEEDKYDTPAILVKTSASSTLSHVKDIVAGAFHTCALLDDETVKCWGYNGDNQLGNGNTESQRYAVSVKIDSDTELTNVKKIASKEDSSCAIWEDKNDSNKRKVKCWGANNFSQLGNGNTTSQVYAVDVIKVYDGHDILSDVKDIVVGSYHSCAIAEENNRAYCWGKNDVYQLGFLNNTSQVYAVGVGVSVILNNVKEIAVGDNHSCAIVGEDKKVHCWGQGDKGQLGSGSFTNSGSHLEVKKDADNDLTDVTKIALGHDHSCAIWKKDGDSGVKCWGGNESGQLGIGSLSNQEYAMDVKIYDRTTNLKDVDDIILGHKFSCSIGKNNKEIKCWGNNFYGQLGTKDLSNKQVAINMADQDDTILVHVKTFVSNGYEDYGQHSCVLLEDGDVRCSGRNHAFELGYGLLVYNAYGMEVPSLRGKNITKMVHDNFSYCALFQEGKVKCWGKNASGQLGDGSTKGTADGKAPEYVQISPGVDLENVKDIVAGSEFFCAISGDDNNLMCWGINNNYQLGIGTLENQSYAVNVKDEESKDLINVSAVRLETKYGCAIVGTDKTVKCWGYMGGGRSYTYKTHAMDIKNSDSTQVLKGVSEIFVAAGSNCALIESNHSLKCWGTNGSGQLGDGTNSSKGYYVGVIDASTSEDLVGIKEVILTDKSYTCAIVGEDRSLKCWGKNDKGQLGVNSNTTTESKALDVKIKNGEEFFNLSQVKKVVPGEKFACAIVGDNNDLMCWGADESGQLGNMANDSKIPYAINVKLDAENNLSQVSDVQIVSDTACALSNETVRCWGKGYRGFYKDSSNNSNVAEIIRDKDGITDLSNVKSFKLYGYSSGSGGISNEYFGYAILNDKSKNVKYWGIDKNIGIQRPGGFHFYPKPAVVKYTGAYPMVLRNTSKSISNVSEVFGSSHTQWFRTEDNKFYFTGLSEYAGNEERFYSSLTTSIDSSLVEEE